MTDVMLQPNTTNNSISGTNKVKSIVDHFDKESGIVHARIGFHVSKKIPDHITETPGFKRSSTNNSTNSTNSTNPNKINNVFKIPIRYNFKVQKLNSQLLSELEMLQSINKDDISIYDTVFKPSNKASSEVLEQFAKYYTTDVTYLKETQQLTKQLNSAELNTIINKNDFHDSEIHDVVSLWEEIKGETGFCEKYLYVDWDFAKSLNNNPNFLHLMCLYNLASPILSLCLPIFVLIVPFIIIKFSGYKLNVAKYVDILKMLIANHAIFKIFTQFNTISTSQKLYLLVSSAFYLFSIYQNILSCIRFYSNMQKIHLYLEKFKHYLGHTIEIMNYYFSKANELTTYTCFLNDMEQNKDILCQFHTKLCQITPFAFSFSKMNEIGHIMHNFYQLYDNPQYNKALLYSFGFNGYFNMLSHIATNIAENKLVSATFCKSNAKKTKLSFTKLSFTKMYYPKFINSDAVNVVKNDCNLHKNMIITGPNASGKTTTLKTALLNILLSQQIGFGCFDGLKLTPFDKFHCYLNIPDTSGRDSLFQAEARRCKEIIDCINEPANNALTHFCIFDELYSGTNPEEAVISANAFMDYIVKHTNVTCILTTHYIQLCKKLNKNKRIKNYHMKTHIIDGEEGKMRLIDYTYLLDVGISSVKGGLTILQDMQYPQEILDLVTK